MNDRQSAAELLASAYHNRLRQDVYDARLAVREAESALDTARHRLLVAEALLRDHQPLLRIAAGIAPGEEVSDE